MYIIIVKGADSQHDHSQDKNTFVRWHFKESSYKD